MPQRISEDFRREEGDLEEGLRLLAMKVGAVVTEEV